MNAAAIRRLVLLNAAALLTLGLSAAAGCGGELGRPELEDDRYGTGAYTTTGSTSSSTGSGSGSGTGTGTSTTTGSTTGSGSGSGTGATTGTSTGTSTGTDTGTDTECEATEEEEQSCYTDEGTCFRYEVDPQTGECLQIDNDDCEAPKTWNYDECECECEAECPAGLTPMPDCSCQPCLNGANVDPFGECTCWAIDFECPEGQVFTDNCGCEPCPDGLDSNWLFDCTCPIPQRDACAEMGLGINEDDCSCEPCPEGQQINDGSCSCTHVDCGEGVWPDTHCECGGDGCPEGKEPVGDHCLCEDRCEDHECDLGESYDYTTCECEAPTCDDEALPTMCAEEGPEGGVAAFSCCPEGDPCNGSWCTL